MHTRPVWVEISRRNLIANYQELRRVAGGEAPRGAIEMIAVVKGDAYGHGMKTCAPLLVGAGAKWLGVTSVEEGAQARSVCPQARILVMSGLWRGEADAVIEHRLTPIVWEEFHLDLLQAAANRLRLPPQSVPAHLEIDTGMSRQGIRSSEPRLAALLRRFQGDSPLRLDGVATHFSAPEIVPNDETARQCERFVHALDLLAPLGLTPSWIHAGNSATLLSGNPFPAALLQAAARLNARLMLRPGLALYGYAPRFSASSELARGIALPSADLSPVLSWKSRVASIRSIEAGESAGYNSTFRAARPTRLALLPLGYADGLNRLLSNRGAALVRGYPAPIAGRISMDHAILDVTDIPDAAIGDEAVLVGKQGRQSITAYDLADLGGTIPYEVLCGIAARVPRVPVD
jgi:alanine racemase